ncbi:hypothetical protein SLE2022_117040 [Rubroshorea leprosula]
MGMKNIALRVLLSISLVIQCIIAQALATPKYYDFVLKESNFTRLCNTKSMLTVNGSFPGPTIYVNTGDTIYVNVHNQGNYGFTIHWHGVMQPRNPWSDGPEYITQCPINPGTNFTYQVEFTTEEGTLWWHAHSDWTRSSIHGAIVIKPAPGKTYPFPEPDGEKVIVFSSWYNKDVNSMVDYILKTGTDKSLISNAYTINGQPGDFKDCSKESTIRMKFEYGKTYLLRLVNAVMNRDLFFMIAGHNQTVVGWDAGYVKPVTTDYIFISTGQTLDILVTANQKPGEYYMIATPYYDAVGTDFDNSTASAIFQYTGNYTQKAPYFPAFVPDYADMASARAFVERLRSLASEEHPIEVPMEVDTRMFITVSANLNPCPNDSCAGPDGYRVLASLNNISFVNPAIDILEAYYRNISGIYKTDFPDIPPVFFNFTADDLTTSNYTYTEQATKVKVLNYNESVEIIFQGTNVIYGGEDHPMHLHGFKFYLIGSGVGIYKNDTSTSSYNLFDPPRANTIVVPKNGWATVRFRADNPGVWLMHCHFERHFSWGMDTVFIVKNGDTAETSVMGPPANMPPCKYTPLLHHVFNCTEDELDNI